MVLLVAWLVVALQTAKAANITHAESLRSE
jgi:hypothetical protein